MKLQGIEKPEELMDIITEALSKTSLIEKEALSILSERINERKKTNSNNYSLYTVDAISLDELLDEPDVFWNTKQDLSIDLAEVVVKALIGR